MSIIERVNLWGQKQRAIFLKPLFAFLTRLHLSPLHLTFTRGLAGPAFIFLYPYYPQTAIIVLLGVQVVFDALDGGLARYQNNHSDRGKFWDILFDHSNYVFAAFTLLIVGGFSQVIIGYHLLIVPIVYLLSTIKESEKKRTDWLIHPYYSIIYFKPFGVLALILMTFGIVNWVNETLLVLNILMTLWSVYYMVVLSKRWKKV